MLQALQLIRIATATMASTRAAPPSSSSRVVRAMEPPDSTTRIGGSLANAFNLPPSSRVTDMVEAAMKVGHATGSGLNPSQAKREVHERAGVP